MNHAKLTLELHQAVADPSAVKMVFGLDKPIVSLHRDGRIELHDGATPDDGARAFWEAVVRLKPDFFK